MQSIKCNRTAGSLNPNQLQGKGTKHINARYLKGQPNNQERNYGGNRYVFSMIQKVERAEQERRRKGREFHSAGSAKAKACLPPAAITSGTVRVAESDK